MMPSSRRSLKKRHTTKKYIAKFGKDDPAEKASWESEEKRTLADLKVPAIKARIQELQEEYARIEAVGKKLKKQQK